jgi:hypothetical protein
MAQVFWRTAVTLLNHAPCKQLEDDCGMAPALLMQRLAMIDWAMACEELTMQGNFVIHNLLTTEACQAMSSAFVKDKIFSRRILLEQQGLGRGEAKYFNSAPAEPVTSLREIMYKHLSPIATKWSAATKSDVRYPAELASYARRSSAGQALPLSSISRYIEGDYEGVHQDSDGETIFPLQMAILLSRPKHDFEGGEFVMTEQRPRMQSRPLALVLQQGDAVIFATSYRPFTGTNGIYRVNLRHGVSRVRSGARFGLSIVFHDGNSMG